MDLYQIHWPGFPILNSWANDAFCRGLVDCQKQGLAKAVGVSNYNVNRMQRAHGVMKVRDLFSYTHHNLFKLEGEERKERTVLPADFADAQNRLLWMFLAHHDL